MKTLLTSLLVSLIFLACSKKGASKQAQLYEQKCASCHIAPPINQATKEIWKTKILPDMAARMGLRIDGYNPIEGLSYEEANAVIKSGIYPTSPSVTKEEWQQLSDYILQLAPDSLAPITYEQKLKKLAQFDTKAIDFKETSRSFITYLEYNKKKNTARYGDLNGNLQEYNFESDKSEQLGRYSSAVVGHTNNENLQYTTLIGKLNPTDIATGQIMMINNGEMAPIMEEYLHRPVYTLAKDLNTNGHDELIVAEFGNLTGALSLLEKTDSTSYKKTVLLNQPGTIRVVAKDMNQDGKEDLIALTSQGDETISILYQEENLSFRTEKVLRFSPIYGSSWFELMDYDGDGDIDIVTVHGDNADKSNILKPYHGMRIHINDGSNQFTESYFYPLYGATRVLARDFDQDDDIDFALISTFPDYENHPDLTFVYLENKDKTSYNFEAQTFEGTTDGRWFLMDAGDIDQDGDQDIIISTFAFVFGAVPEDLSKIWNEKSIDLMLLENRLK